ncbi:MAG: VRR-NUC domain-containing protein [Patescibacteria group bacterium]|nr:VRR-NUC domain-containing protein [Patescibacteria group bacterium]
MARQTPEGIAKAQIRAILEEWGVFFFMPVAGFYGRRGVSDFICCFNGKFLAVEVKATKRDKPTKLQEDFLDAVLRNGGIALVVCPDNTTVLTSTLRRIAHGERF